MATGLKQESVDAFMASRDEPAWLTDIRHGAWKHYCQIPMPSQRDEEWMRTDIRLFRMDRFGEPEKNPGENLPHAILGGEIEVAGMMTSKNSQSLDTQLDPALAAQGVLFGDLESMVCEHADLIQPHLMSRAVVPRVQ